MISKASFSCLRFILVFIPIFFGCGADKLEFPRPDIYADKSDDARKACQESRLLEELSLEADFVIKLLECSSVKDDQGNASLAALRLLVNQLGSDGVEEAIALLKTKVDGSEGLPILRASSLALDRGLSQNLSLDLANSRSFELQKLLTSLPVGSLLSLVKDWSEAEQFSLILKELVDVGAQLPPSSLTSIINEFLQGNTWGPTLKAILRDLLERGELSQSFESLISPQLSMELEDKDCWLNWLDKRDPKYNQCSQIDSTSRAKLGIQRWEDATTSLSEKQIQALIDTGFSWLDDWSELESGRKLELLATLTSGLKELSIAQKSPSLYLAALLELIGQANAQSLSSLREAAQTLLEPNYDPTLNQLRAKLAETKLVETLHSQIINGGIVAGCSDLKIPALDTRDFESFYRGLSQYFTPSAECWEMPPISVLMAHELGFFIHTSCQVAGNGLPCIPTPEIGTWNDYEIEQPLLQARLLEDSLERVYIELEMDPYYLESQNLAYGPLDAKMLDELNDKVRGQKSWSTAELLQLETWIEKDTKLRSVLASDFIEKLLYQSVERLQAQAEQFSDFVPEEDVINFTPEFKAARIFSGTYPGSQLEWLLKSKLNSVAQPLENSSPELVESFSQDERPWRLFTQSMKDADSLFKNPSYAKQNEDVINTVVLGSSILNYVSFDESANFSLKNSSSLLRPSQSFEASLDLESPNWAKWDKFLLRGALPSKDFPAELSLDLAVAKQLMFAELFATDWFEEAPIQSRASLSDYFESEAYSLSQSRAIVLYFLQNYHKSNPYLPADARVYGASRADENTPIRGFFNASFLQSPFEPSKPWSVYLNMRPENFAGTYSSLDEWKSSLLPEFETWQESGQDLFEVRGYGLKRSLKDFKSDIFNEETKLFSALNLLSYTETRSAAYLQPSIGFAGQVCAPKKGAPKSYCALEIGDETAPIELQYENYRNFLAKHLTSKLCPLARSSIDLTDWQSILGLDLKSLPAECELLREEGVVEIPESLRTPVWLMDSILSDIFELGKNPRLKNSLKLLPSKLRWQKLTNPNARSSSLSSKYLVKNWLQQARLAPNQQAAAITRYRSQAAKSLHSGTASVIQQSLSQYESLLPAELYESFLIQSLSKDFERDPVEELLSIFIETQLEHQDESAIALIVAMQERILASESAKKALALSLSQLNSLQMQDFFGRDLPLAVLALFGNQMDWQDPGLLLAKQALAQHNLQAISELTRRLESKDWIAATELVGDLLDALGENRVENLETLLRVVSSQLTSYDPSQQNFLFAEQLDGFIFALASNQFTAEFDSKLLSLIDAIKLPLKDLNGQSSPSLKETLQASLMSILTRASTLVSAHFNAKTRSSDSTDFWTKLGLTAINATDTNPIGSLALAGMLGEKAFGLSQEDPWLESALKNNNFQANVSSLSERISQIPTTIWLDAIKENNEFLTTNRKFLAFSKQKLVWENDPESKDYRRALDALNELSNNKLGISDSLDEILNTWLSKQTSFYETVPH